MGARRGARRALCVPSTTWLYAMTLSRVRPGTFSTMSALRAMRAGVECSHPRYRAVLTYVPQHVR